MARTHRAIEWHDLTHRIDADTPRLPFLDAPRVTSLEEPLLAASELVVATHAGTHVEAPRHRFPDGAGIDAYPPSRFLGEAVAWSPDVGARDPVEATDLAPSSPTSRRATPSSSTPAGTNTRGPTATRTTRT